MHQDGNNTEGPIRIAALYLFADMPADGLPVVRERVESFMTDRRIRGTILLAPEGINGTVAGTPDSVDAFVAFLRTHPVFGGALTRVEPKYSWAPGAGEGQPFLRTKVKIKREIVTMGVEGIDLRAGAGVGGEGGVGGVGTYVDPRDWNNLIDDPDVLVIDTRNDYETRIGTFVRASGEPATDPRTASFTEFPGFVERELAGHKHTKIAMFCTGGIRCEKATAYLKQQGFADVFHLRGGILKYLEDIPASESRWHGECFVFDERVSVDHELRPGVHQLCRACRRPVSPEEMLDHRYAAGVSCPMCFDEHTERRRRAHAEREKQVRLAEARGDRHLGPR